MATTKEFGAEADDERSSTFSLTEEDHTLANSLRFVLNKDPRVSFCGYSVPHPSENRVNIRVQTIGEASFFMPRIVILLPCLYLGKGVLQWSDLQILSVLCLQVAVTCSAVPLLEMF